MSTVVGPARALAVLQDVSKLLVVSADQLSVSRIIWILCRNNSIYVISAVTCRCVLEQDVCVR